MPIATTQTLLNQQHAFLAEYTELSNGLLDSLTSLILQSTDSRGFIPLPRLQEIQNAAQDATLRLYVDPSQGGYADDGYTPVAPYTRLLNRHIISVTVGVIAGHSTWLRQRPDDVVSWLSLTPVTTGNAPYPFRSNPLAQYDPFHTWVDPNGWQLSDRVWQTGLQARQQIGSYLDYHIRNGTSALDMSRGLRGFLVPNEALRTTNRPYGTTASYSGMRLARTEIARAHTEALFAAARANPYVTGIDWRLSPSHPKRDICDTLATIGMGGQRLREPYPIDTAPHVIEDSHPQCLCANSSATDDTATITQAIRDLMEDYPTPPGIVPLDIRAFLIALLGTELAIQIYAELRS